jgi:hypothetical protein
MQAGGCGAKRNDPRVIGRLRRSVTSGGSLDGKSEPDGTIAVIRAGTNKPDPTLSVSKNQPITLQYADELLSLTIQEHERWAKPCSKN